MDDSCSAASVTPSDASSIIMPEQNRSGSPDSPTSNSLEDDGLSGLENKFDRALRLEAATAHRVPTEDLTQEELDALFARDMYSLSSEERAHVLHDMHGVPDVVDETPSFVTERRSELLHELDVLLANTRVDTSAYEQALAQDAEYVTGARTQLIFLRSVGFNDVASAALRLVQFFQLKLDLFGPSKLTKDITVKDLNKEDKKSLESGFFQILPVRDSAGRAIMVGIPCLRNYKDENNFKRTFFYMAMAIIHDVSTQKNGVTFIGYNMGNSRTVDRTAAWCVSQLRKILPMRVIGMHYCYDDFRMRAMMVVAMLVMGGSGRVRFRGHYGTLEENFYKLQTFGIPTDAIPVTSDGEPKNKAHRQWLKMRAKQEGTPEFDTEEYIVVPNRLDVLFGRGKPIQEHFGNIRYHSLLDYYQDAYERAKKFEKMQISQRVVDTVHSFDGRFLKQEGAGWVAVDDLVARDKVSHAFRTRRANSTSSSVPVPSNAVKRIYENTTSSISSTSSPVPVRDKITSNDNNSPLPTALFMTSRNNDPSTVTDNENEADSLSGTEDDMMDESTKSKRAKIWQADIHEVEQIGCA